jgi:PAS domain S-box-containing protein
MFNSVSDAVFVHKFGEDARPSGFLEVNDNACRLLGYTREELLQMRVVDIIAPEEHFNGPANAKRLLADGHATWEGRFAAEDGRRIPVEVNARVFTLDGSPTIISSVRDIAERKDAEARLQAQNQRFQRIIESTDAGYFRIGTDGCYEDVNAAWLRMHGFTKREEAIGLHFSSVQVPVDTAKAAEVVDGLVQGDSTRSGEFSRVRCDGTIGYHSFSANPVVEGDRVVGVEGFLVDISDQKKAEQERQQHEQQYRSLFNSMQEGVAVHRLISSNGIPQTYVLLDVNRRYEEIIGVKREDVVNKLASEAYGTPDAPYLQEFASVVETGAPHQFETYFPPMDRHFVISVTSMGNDRFATIFFDVTEQKKAQQAIQQANEAVAKAEAHYRLMFNSVSDALLVHTFGDDGLSSHFLEVNDNACHLLGCTRDELLQMGSFDLDPPEDHPNIRTRAQRILAERHLMWEGTFVRKDGWRIPVEVNTHLVDLGGSQTIISSVRDISERKEAEKQYRDIFEGAIDGIYRKVPHGTFLAVNPAFARIFGYESGQEVITTVNDSGHQIWVDPNERLRFLQLLASTGAVSGYECQAKRKDGTEIWVSLSSHTVCGKDGRILYHEGFVQDITERKRTEATLREHQRLLTVSQKIAGLGSYALDIVTGTWTSSVVLDDIFGIDAAFTRSVEGWMSLVHPEWREQMLDHFTNEVIGEHHRFDKEYKIVRHSDGHVRWVHGLGELEFDVNGQALRMVGTILDVTERKGMEDDLRRSEEKFAIAFRSGPAMTVLFRLEEEGNRISDVNEAFERVTGYRREEVIGRTSLELGLWVNPGELDAATKQVRASGRVRSSEYHFRKKSGDICTGLLSADLIDIGGKLCAISTTIDITEQKKAEADMRSLVTAIEQSADTIVITDFNGTIQYCNPAFEKVTGYSKEEAIGQNPRVLKSGKHSKEFYENMWATIRQGTFWSGHLINKRKDGSFYEEDATISPIRDNSGKISGFVAVKRDVTERRQLEDQLRQAQKLESIGRLAGGVAHDFNNLLTVINGYSGFLLRALKAGDPLRSYAEEITTAGERAASLTKQLLAFSRKQVIEPKVLDLNAIIRESTVMLRRLIGDDIVLETHLDGSLGQVIADPDQIHQVIMNLAVNARDAMPDGGALDIETLNVELTREDGAAGSPERTPGRYVLMTVTDTGHGMDETIRKDIFEPFFTTKGVGKGTGLGLSTVYGIIRQNGGWIDVWSEVGVGTTFRMYVRSIDACPVAERKVMSAPTEGGGETILVVEDQKAVRSFAKAALRQHGYPVLEACDGDEALSVAMEHLGQIDLLLTDVVMPGLNGRELSKHLKQLYPHLKVLFISGYTADVIAYRGVLDPGVAFLHKPFGQEELARKVREVLDTSPLPSLEL